MYLSLYDPNSRNHTDRKKIIEMKRHLNKHGPIDTIQRVRSLLNYNE